MTSAELAQLQTLPARVAELETQIKRLIQSEPLMDLQQAAEFLSITPAALRASAYRGTVPVIRVGRRLRFRASDLSRG